MNERFEKWARDYFGLPVAQSWQMILNGGAGSRVVREITIAHLAWQAALSAAAPNNGTYCIHGIKCALCAEGISPAGTGQPDEVAWLLEHEINGVTYYACVDGFMLGWTTDPNEALRLARRHDGDKLAEIMEDADYVRAHIWPAVRDSVKGEGETAPPECGVCGAKPGEKGHGADAMGNVHHVPSAPSPEELAREIMEMMGYEPADWPAMERKLAALLRARGERWIPVSERKPIHPAHDVLLWNDSDKFQWIGTVADIKAGKATHWRPLPALPREGA